MSRTWSDTENNIIRNNYPDKGVIETVKIFHTMGFSNRDYFSIAKQASKLKVKRIRKRPKGKLMFQEK